MTKEGAGDFGERMNRLPKHVASTTLDKAEWNAQVIKGNVAEEVAKLKQDSGQDILIEGSAALINSLLPYGVIDEYRLMIHPVVVGHGKRLFQDGVDTTTLRLVETKTFPSGVIVLTYQAGQDESP